MIWISSSEVVKALLERGKSFLVSAKANFDRGLYDIACFEADQAAQLVLKAYVQRVSGSVPRTHSIRRLLAELGSLTERAEEVARFVSRLRGNLITLEDADLCITVAEEVIKFAKSLIE